MTEITNKPYPYPHNPARLRITRSILRILGDIIVLNLAFNVKVSGLEKVPKSGPTMVVFNHLSVVDPAVVGLLIKKRDAIPLAKAELAHNLATVWITWGWSVILIRRGEVDRTALRYAKDVLESKQILMVAPEGHRNKNGMRDPKEGTVMLANMANAVIVPIGVSGTEDAIPRLLKLKRSKITVNIGNPFRLKPGVNRKQYTQATNEIMYQIAQLVDPKLRGEFSDLSQATTDTIEFVSAS